jgi:hypothetical protein
MRNGPAVTSIYFPRAIASIVLPRPVGANMSARLLVVSQDPKMKSGSGTGWGDELLRASWVEGLGGLQASGAPGIKIETP